MNIGQAPAAAPRRKVFAKRRKASSPDPARPDTASEVAHLKAAVASMGLRLSESVHRICMLEAALRESRRSPTASARSGAPADLEKRLQRAEDKFDTQLARHKVQLQQALLGQQQEAAGEASHRLSSIQQQLDQLQKDSRRQNLVVTAPSAMTKSQLLNTCIASLAASNTSSSGLTARHLSTMGSRGSVSQRWHLRLADDQTKHALFSCSKGFREQKIFLDDDLTKLQLEGRHSLAARKASLTGQGHRTWWRRDVLCWADASGMHRQQPVAACA